MELLSANMPTLVEKDQMLPKSLLSIRQCLRRNVGPPKKKDIFKLLIFTH
jgi:hypothetical protein